MMFVLCSLESA